MNSYLLFILIIIIGWYFRSYIQEKAKNLATKEDISSLTKTVEEIKFNFSKELEKIKYKYQLEANLKKVFQEKTIKSIDDVNELLVEIMKYCHGNIAKRHPNEHYVWSNVDDIDSSKHFHYYRVAIDKVSLENSLYLPEKIKEELHILSSTIGRLSSMELTFGNSKNEEDVQMAFNSYTEGFKTVKKCQENIFNLLSVV